jgi:hypothetical protein
MAIPLQKNSKFRQGVFTPKNPAKYIGKSKPVYRSSWELKFFRWCDDNANVVEWASESIIIPYISPLDRKVHRYYTDGVLALKEGEEIKKYIIEIKPLSQVLPPKPGKKKKTTVIYENQRYVQNMAKWEAARKYAAKHNFNFWILTEKELGLNK